MMCDDKYDSFKLVMTLFTNCKEETIFTQQSKNILDSHPQKSHDSRLIYFYSMLSYVHVDGCNDKMSACFAIT